MTTTFQQRKENALPRAMPLGQNFVVSRAENAFLWDGEGRRYLDFAGGIGVLNTGHCHPKVTAAIQAQAAHFIHTCFAVVPYDGYVSLAEKINAATPGTHAKKTMLFNTGAEAVENAIKIARYATKRSAVIACNGAFHGRSMMALSLTGKISPYKAGFGPLFPEVFHIPFPQAGDKATQHLEASKKALENLFKTDIEASRVAAIIVEPVQGEGGFNPLSDVGARWLREVCDEHGIVLIIDEVQSGFARTGKMFAIEHSGITPDLMVMAKSLAAGMPLSAVCGKAELMDAPLVGGLGGTYTGNPLAVAAALAVFDIIKEQNLVERSALLGHKLVARLQGLRSKVNTLHEVRGLGSMVAAEFRDANGTALPNLVKSIQAEALKRGLILITCGVDANVVRFLYPLTIEDASFDEALNIIEQSILAAR